MRYPVIPSIDISEGKAVKRVRGVPGTEIVRTSIESILRYILSKSPPISRIHVVDLDGASKGCLVNLPAIKEIVRTCREHGVEVQVGGGIRDVESAETIYSMGAFPVIGSIVYTRPETAIEILKRIGPENVYVALDVSERKIAIHGWSEKTHVDDPVEHLAKIGAQNVIYTVTDVEGTLQGPMHDPLLVKRIRARLNIVDLIYAGGVRTRQDIVRLLEQGFTGVIVGRAMYELGLDSLLV